MHLGFLHWMQRAASVTATMDVADPESPEQLFEVAELEMLQTNYPHATKLYQEILDKHPDSKFAEKARVKLKELQELQIEKETQERLR